MSETFDGWCEECRDGNHENHQAELAGICIGCACDWVPAVLRSVEEGEK